jgi:hypothetical protein
MGCRAVHRYIYTVVVYEDQSYLDKPLDKTGSFAVRLQDNDRLA